MSRVDISAILVFHHERGLACASIVSFARMVAKTRNAGLSVETLALLDDPDPITAEIVTTAGSTFDRIEQVNYRDLGLTRNHGTRVAIGEYLSFLDGDDLWGAEWLCKSHIRASSRPGAILHPEYVYLFFEGDFSRHTLATKPRRGTRSHYMRHIDSPTVDPGLTAMDNAWTANAFARREVYLAFPYKRVDRDAGLGFEDWTWNIETLCGGHNHLAVPDTVHLVRMKEGGSLGQQIAYEGLLPDIPKHL